ncbi:unnamed protein product, partial [marine sediment metagenome]
YITISATYDFFPIREYSTAAFPTENLDKCRQKAVSLVGQLSNDYLLIYLGGMAYFGKFFSANGDSVTMLISPFQAVVTDETLIQAQLSMGTKANELSPVAREYWLEVSESNSCE